MKISARNQVEMTRPTCMLGIRQVFNEEGASRKASITMGQDALNYTPEEFLLELLRDLGPNDFADLMFKGLALAVSTQQIDINTVVRFILTCQKHEEELADHFRDAGTRSGSFGLPRA